MDEEGWYEDPFEVHEARWFSAGHPTDLVSDAGKESRDAPPDQPLPRPLVRWEAEGFEGDLRRADDASRCDGETDQQEAMLIKALDTVSRYGQSATPSPRD